MSKWINFAELRKQLSFADILRQYRVELKPKADTDQMTGECPLPNHGKRNGRTFSANMKKGIWQCFGCKASGNVLDFAVLMEGLNKENGADVRKVALSLYQRYVLKDRPRSSTPTPRPQGPPKLTSAPVVINPPLDFELKTLECDHAYFPTHKLEPETVSRFGIGFCRRGSLAGKIAVPLHDDAKRLVGYSSFAPEESLIPAAYAPKYSFPASREVEGATHVLDKAKLLYNAFRVGGSVRDLIVAQWCHTVWALWQGGFADGVALMGDECSDDQAALITILTADAGRVWLLTENDPAGASCAQSLLIKVAPNRLCRWVRIPNDDEISAEHPLVALLPRR